MVGFAEHPPEPDGGGRFDPAGFDVLLTGSEDPPFPWVTATISELDTAVAGAPGAAGVLVQVLRATEGLAVPDALVVESMTYSMLQHGGEFRLWLSGRDPVPRRSGTRSGDPVLLERHGDRLEIQLTRPEVHNALDAAMRDALVDAFEVVDCDPTISEVHLRGAGPSFCSGGDLTEFGLARDAVAAHRIRVERSVGLRVHDHASMVTAHIHGHCVGAGIEIAAFAGRVLAAPDTSIRLPELSLGLIPGAGGTASLARRIGRHRTAYLALSGRAIDATTARRWGLVDELVDDLVDDRRSTRG